MKDAEQLLDTDTLDKALEVIDQHVSEINALATVDKEEYENGNFASTFLDKQGMVYPTWKQVAQHYTQNATSFRVIKGSVPVQGQDFKVIALVYWPK